MTASPLRRWTFKALLLLAYWLAATASVDVFMERHAFFEGHPHPEYGFEPMIERTAHRPFVYRAMMPVLVNAIDAALPRAVRERYQPTAAAVVERYAKPGTPEWRTPERERKYMIAFVLMALFAIGALWALRALLSAAFPEQPGLRDAGPLYFGVLLPLSFMNGGFMYDFAELFLMFAAFALAWRGRWIPMLAVLALGIWNKETAALLTIMLAAALYDRVPRAEWRRVVGAMIAVSVVGVLTLRAIYGDRPGSTMYDHVLENLEFWSNLSSWFASMTVYVPLLPAPRGLNLAMVVPLVVVLGSGWRQRSATLRRLLVASAAVQLPLFFLFCWRDETRNLSLLYPSLCLNVCAAAAMMYRAPRPVAVAAPDGPDTLFPPLRPSPR